MRTKKKDKESDDDDESAVDRAKYFLNSNINKPLQRPKNPNSKSNSALNGDSKMGLKEAGVNAD